MCVQVENIPRPRAGISAPVLRMNLLSAIVAAVVNGACKVWSKSGRTRLAYLIAVVGINIRLAV